LARWRPRWDGLWRHPDFLKLWGGQTVSIFGTLVTRFALPLLAAVLLGAGPVQIALLSAAEVAPGLILGLVAGAWVDRLRRRPILIAADVGRALVLCVIPLAALLHVLRIEQLYAVALLTSVLGVCFDVAYPAYLPSLIGREQLVEGNGKLEASSAVAEVAGWGGAGLLVQLLSAPLAILVDAFSYVVSAVSLVAIRTREPAPRATRARAAAGRVASPSIAREIGQGMRFALADPLRRALVGAEAVSALFGNALGTVIILYLVRDLHVQPAVMGAIFAVGGVSAFVGATVCQRLTRRWGVGRTILVMPLISKTLAFCVPLAGGPLPLAVALQVAAQTGDGAMTIYAIDRLSLLQALTPDHLQGRMHATARVIEGGATLGGLLLGGALGELIGLRPTLWVACSGGLLAVLWLALSPVRHLRQMPVLAAEEPETVAAAAG
jgi:MFS family permease